MMCSFMFQHIRVSPRQRLQSCRALHVSVQTNPSATATPIMCSFMFQHIGMPPRQRSRLSELFMFQYRRILLISARRNDRPSIQDRRNEVTGSPARAHICRDGIRLDGLKTIAVMFLQKIYQKVCSKLATRNASKDWAEGVSETLIDYQ